VSRGTILVTGADLAPQALELLAGFDVVYAGKAPTPDDLVALSRRHDPVGIIVRYGKVGADVMEVAPSLRVISKHGSGTDTIDKDAAAALGIQVRAAVGANAAAVAEQALALLLAARPLRRRPPRLHRAGRAGHDLARIRRPLAALPADRGQPRPGECAHPAGVQAGRAAGEHRARRAGGRSGTARAVRSGQVAAAGLDSFAVEPMAAPHPLHGESNLILSPHIGGVTGDAYVNMGVGAARNVLAVLETAQAA